jgi:hypothetical protein
MIEDTSYAEQDEGWSRRGSRIILGDDHEDEERLSIQAEKIVHRGFFNSTLQIFCHALPARHRELPLWILILFEISNNRFHGRFR